MKLKSFSVYDAAVAAFLPPFFMPSDAVAIRVFADCCQDGAHAFCRNPSDYTLFRIGEFDDASGDFTMDQDALILGVEAKKRNPSCSVNSTGE